MEIVNFIINLLVLVIVFSFSIKIDDGQIFDGDRSYWDRDIDLVLQ